MRTSAQTELLLQLLWSLLIRVTQKVSLLALYHLFYFFPVLFCIMATHQSQKFYLLSFWFLVCRHWSQHLQGGLCDLYLWGFLWLLSWALPFILLTVLWRTWCVFLLVWIPHLNCNVPLEIAHRYLIVLVYFNLLLLGDLLTINKGAIARVEILKFDFAIFEGQLEMGSADRLRIDKDAVLKFGISAQDHLSLPKRMWWLFLALFVEHFYDH